MKKKDYVKFLLPLVAVVVIVESVVLLTRMEDESRVRSAPSKEVETDVSELADREPQMALSFATETRKMKVGEKYNVEVNVAGLVPVALDSLELYVRYDAEALKIDGLSFSDKLAKPIFGKVSEKKQLVAVTYLVMEEGGFKLAEGEVVSLLKFEVQPLTAGNVALEFGVGNVGDESVIMFVESKTGKVLPFSVNNLNIEVE